MGAEPALETGRLKNTCVNLRNELLSDLSSILTRVVDGTCDRAMRSEQSMADLVAHTTDQFDNAAFASLQISGRREAP